MIGANVSGALWLLIVFFHSDLILKMLSLALKCRLGK